MTITTQELDNNILIDFNQIKPVVNPDLICFWDDIGFLYDTNFMYYDGSCSSSNYSSCPSSPATTTTLFSPSNQYPSSPIMENKNNNTLFEPLSSIIMEKPHTCSYCSRSFSRRHDLERHTRVHTGIKPYHCPGCQKTFARSDARRRHFRSDPLCSNHIQVQKLVVHRASKKGVGRRCRSNSKK